MWPWRVSAWVMCRASCRSSSTTRMRIASGGLPREPGDRQAQGRAAPISGLYPARPTVLSWPPHMNVLFIGGTGIISTACTELAVARGLDVTLLNRSQRRRHRRARTTIAADIADAAATARALAGRTWDGVVDFIAFTPADVESRLGLFRGKTAQYIFISSASAYQKPLTRLADHGVDAAREPALGIFAQQDRLRGAPDPRLPRGGLPGRRSSGRRSPSATRSSRLRSTAG